MASAPGSFFSTTAMSPSTSSSNGPQHLMAPPQEKAGYPTTTPPIVQEVPPIASPAMNRATARTTQAAVPQAFPITVTTAGQPPPGAAATTTIQQRSQQQQQQQPPPRHGPLHAPPLGSVVNQQFVSNTPNHHPVSIQKQWPSRGLGIGSNITNNLKGASIGQKRPATAALVAASQRARIASSGITLSLKGGFTLPLDTLMSASSSSPKPRFYSSASQATVRAQQVGQQQDTTKQTNVQEQPLTSNRRVNSAPDNLNGQQQQQGYKYRKVVGGKRTIPRSASAILNKEPSPQQFLDKLIESRGYSAQKFCSLEGGYYCKPSPLQKASYGIGIVKAVRQSNAPLLKKMLQCGLSPNPCNDFGESVVHMVCRRGDYKLLQIMLDAGCSLQVTDDFGRTPLHDACWTAEPCFECVELILNADERLLHVVDCRGAPPLSYVKKDHWKDWIDFFQRKSDRFWKPRNLSTQGQEPPPKLSQEAPHSQTIQDPGNAVAVEIAAMIASGKLDPQEYLKEKLQQDKKDGNVSEDKKCCTKEKQDEESSSDATKKDSATNKVAATKETSRPEASCGAAAAGSTSTVNGIGAATTAAS